jgi:6-phosphogluconolactonase
MNLIETLRASAARDWMIAFVLLGLALCGGCGGGSTLVAPAVPRFAYAVDSADAVSSFAVDPATGQLRHNGYVLSPASTGLISTTSALAPALALNPSGFIHFVPKAAPSLVVASIDGPTGILAPRTLAWPGTLPFDIVGHPSGRFAYVIDVNSNVQAATVNSTSGDLTPVGTPFSLGQIGTARWVAVDPQGTFLLAAGQDGAFPNFVFRVGTVPIDQTSGALTALWRKASLPFDPGAVVIHPGGRCGFAVPLSPGAQIAPFAIASTGAPSNATAITAGTKVVDLAFDPKGTTLFTLDDDAVGAFPITDSTTCALGTKVGPVHLAQFGNTKLSVDPSGHFVYATSPSANAISALTIGAGPTLSSPVSFLTRPGVTGFAPVFTSGTLAVSYLPVFLYAVNYSSNDISIFSIGSTGALTAAGKRSSLGTGPFAIAIDPWSRFAFVANRDSGTVAAFTINRSTGALSATAPAVSVGTKPVALAIDSSGRFLFVANNGSADVRVFAINQSTGQLAAPPGSGTMLSVPVLPQPTSATVDPTGTFLFLSTVGTASGTGPLLSTLVINEIGATLGPTGQTASVTVTGYTGVGVDVEGALAFAADTTLNVVVTIPLTNTATLATPGGSTVTPGSEPVSLAVDPLGRFVYAVTLLDFTLSVYSIDRAHSKLISGTPVNLGLTTMPRAVIVDPSGQYLYVADENGRILAFSINQASGALTAIGSVPAGSGPFALGIARLPI